MKKIAIIAAVQKRDRGIGFQNQLLFKISDDLKRFKRLTSENPIIMGRLTWESIGSRALPKRTNIVISKNPDFNAEGATVCASLEEALKVAEHASGKTTFIIGGAKVYEQALSAADELCLTIAESDAPADAFFPEYEEFKTEVEREDLFDEKTSLYYSFVTLQR